MPGVGSLIGTAVGGPAGGIVGGLFDISGGVGGLGNMFGGGGPDTSSATSTGYFTTGDLVGSGLTFKSTIVLAVVIVVVLVLYFAWRKK